AAAQSSQFGVYAQRYNANGVAQGSELRVNNHLTAQQAFPMVAADSAGDFVITWQSFNPLFNRDILAQRYNAAGAAQGTQFQVNPFSTSGTQVRPSVAMDAGGDF